LLRVTFKSGLARAYAGTEQPELAAAAGTMAKEKEMQHPSGRLGAPASTNSSGGGGGGGGRQQESEGAWRQVYIYTDSCC